MKTLALAPPVQDHPLTKDTGYFPGANRTSDYIQNSSCRFEIRHAPSGQSYVVSIPNESDPKEPTTYLGSTAATLLDYPLSILPFVHRNMSAKAPSLAGGFFRRISSRSHRSIGLFNEPFSNVLLPENFLSILEEILPRYQDEYPDHPLLIRGLVQQRLGHAFSRLRQLGFFLIPYRRIFIFDGTSGKNDSKYLKMDLAELRKYRHLFSQPSELLPAEDYEKMALLYRNLYLGRYSLLNPGYTAAFIRHAHQESLLNFSICRNPEGRLVGFSCFSRSGGWMNSGLIGHDREIMPRPSIYFTLTAGEAEMAMQKGFRFNMGAGAQKTKLMRGFVPDYEYLAVRLPPASLLHAVRDLGRAWWR